MSLDPMAGGGAPMPATYWRPRESERGIGIYTEKKFGDELLGQFGRGAPPDDATVTHVTLILYRGEKPIVAYQQGKQLLPEGEVHEGESAADAVKRVAMEQTGAIDPSVTALGAFRLRATTQSKTQAPGTITYRVLYAGEVSELADFPSDPAFERRIILQRDLNTLLRSSYVEKRQEYTETLDDWLLDRLKANLREG